MQDAKQRRAPRISIALSGSLLGREPEPVSVLDLSLTGCLVRCQSLLDRGSIRDLRLVLGDDSLTAKVRVREASRDGSAAEGETRFLTGLEFLTLPAQQAMLLRAFLERARRAEPGPGAPGAP